jgi:hypothetical protein
MQVCREGRQAGVRRRAPEIRVPEKASGAVALGKVSKAGVLERVSETEVPGKVSGIGIPERALETEAPRGAPEVAEALAGAPERVRQLGQAARLAVLGKT